MIRVAAALIALVVVAGLFNEAGADSAVGITPGKIDVDDELKPGGRYALPPVIVINTGKEKQEYEVIVSFTADQVERRPAGKWLTIEPQHFELDPSKSQQVQFRVSLPASAAPGQYFALLEAQSVARNGQSFQPSVATKLTFSVGNSGWLETSRRQVNNFLDDSSPWIYVLPLVGAAAILARWSSRRVRFRLPFEPR